MRYLIQENDTVQRIFITFKKPNDFNTFSFNIYFNDSRHYGTIEVDIKDILNSDSEIVLVKGFASCYRFVKSKMREGTPVANYLKAFEASLSDEARLLLEVVDG